jgi:hypothetical protein
LLNGKNAYLLSTKLPPEIIKIKYNLLSQKNQLKHAMASSSSSILSFGEHYAKGLKLQLGLLTDYRLTDIHMVVGHPNSTEYCQQKCTTAKGCEH